MPRLFAKDATVIASWKLLTPVLEAWRNNPENYPLLSYPAGSDGPV
ncbi:MAG: hypothetical protein PHO37_00870 [Kiritimatiellae bacterium]|nr:hypothetical protein [Kiritimatiellia bacterium]